MNKLRVQGSLAPRVILMFALLTVVSCGGASEADLLSQAKDFYQQGDYRSASIQLKTLLQKNGQHQEGRLLLGKALLAGGDSAGAVEQFQRALNQGMSPDDIVPDLSQALLSGQQYDKLVTELQYEDSWSPQLKTVVQNARAEAFITLGNFEAAQIALAEVKTRDPNSLDGQLGLVEVTMASGAVAEAGRLFEAIDSTQGETSQRYWRAKALLESTNDLEAASASYQKAIELNTKSRMDRAVNNYFGKAEVDLALGDYDSVEEVAVSLGQFGQGSPLPDYLRARSALAQNDSDGAYEFAVAALKKAPGFPPAEALLGSIHYSRGEYGQAETYLSGVLAADPTDSRVRKLLAATRLQQSEPQSALDVLGTDVAQSDADILGMMGIANMLSGETAEGLELLKRALVENPDDPTAILQMAEGYLSADQPKEALDTVELLNGREDMQANFIRVGAYSALDSDAEATTLAESVVSAAPDDEEVLNTLLSAFLRNNKTDSAKSLLNFALQQRSDKTSLLIRLARIATFEGDATTANAYFDQVLSSDANNVDALRGLSELAARSGDQAAAMEWLDKAIAVDPENAELLAAKSIARLERGDVSDGLALARKAVQVDESSFQAQLASSILWFASNNLEFARQSAQAAVALRDWDSRGHSMLGRIQLALGDRETAQVHLQNALRRNPNDFEVRELLSRVLLTEGKTQEAYELLDNMAETSRKMELQGDLAMIQQKPNEALALYEKAFAGENKSREAAIKTFIAARDSGDGDAIDDLTKWGEGNPDDPAVPVIIGDAHLESGDHSSAIPHYERAINMQPDNAIALNNLAWTYYLAKDDRARTTAERAVQLQPNSGDIADTLGWIQAQEGDYSAAVATLRRAVDAATGVSPMEAEIRYHLAYALSKNGNTQEATDMLRALLETGAGFPSQTQARELLRSLMN